MRYISLHALSKAFTEEKDLFQNLSLLLSEGDICGIVGRNGEGKSTILKIITGEVTPDEGTVEVSSNTSIGYHSQFLELEHTTDISLEGYILSSFGEVGELFYQIYELSGQPDCDVDKLMELQARFEELGGYSIQAKVDACLIELGLSQFKPDDSITMLSGGQKTRLQLAKILIQSPDILLLDEPTNHLDLVTIEWLEDYIKNRKGITIVVSHDRSFLNATTNKILELEKGHSNLYLGNYDFFLESKAEILERNRKEAEIVGRHLKTMKQAYNVKSSQATQDANKIPDKKKYGKFAKGGLLIKSGKKARTAKLYKRRLDADIEKTQKLKPVQYRKMVFDVEATESTGDFVVRVNDFNVTVAHKTLAHCKNFEVERGARVVIKGPNGSGKTTFLRNLIQAYVTREEFSDSIRFGGNISVGYYSQEHEEIDLTKTLLDDFRESVKMSEDDAVNYLYKMTFTYRQLQQKTSSLSQGEKSRLALTKLLVLKHNVLILDEPTNHLDIPSKETLEESLEKYTGTIICISHDRYFLNKLGITRTYVIDNQEIQLL